MHQREASVYGRKFFYGRKRTQVTPVVLDTLTFEPGIGFIPPEFDDLQNAELDTIEELSRIER